MFCHDLVPVTEVEPRMRRSFASLALAALLYGAIGPTANARAADLVASDLTASDLAGLQNLRRGELAKLVVHAEPRPRLDARFSDADGNPVGVADFAGKVVLLNFWATWCPPCRAEMPSIDRLAGRMAGDDFAVLAVSADRGSIDRPARFLAEIGVKHLALMHDPGGKAMIGSGVLGLPVTLILDREGREIARLIGDAEWDSPEARALIDRVIEITGPDRA
jgi:thiol-disulfide isomerase/thioredoxin